MDNYHLFQRCVIILNICNSDSNAFFPIKLDAASFQAPRYCKAAPEPLLQTTAKTKSIFCECRNISRIIWTNSINDVLGTEKEVNY